MFGVIIWSIFGILMVRAGVLGFSSDGLRFVGKDLRGVRGKLTGSALIIIGIASFAFAFYRLLFLLKGESPL